MDRPVRIALILLGSLPLPVLHAISWLLGLLFWLTPNKQQRITLRHMDLCLAELKPAERRRIARQSLMHSAQAVVEAPSIWFGPRERLGRWLRNDAAQQQIRQLAADGKGVFSCARISAPGNSLACSAPLMAA